MTRQGAVAMYLDRGPDVTAVGDYIAVGSPGESIRGAVNLYKNVGGSFTWFQKILFKPPTKTLAIGAGLAMGNRLLAVGSANQYVYIYRFLMSTTTSPTWQYTLEASLCVCGCSSAQQAASSTSFSNATYPCNSFVMPQDGSLLAIADVGAPQIGGTAGSVPNAGGVYIYTPTLTGTTATWSNSQYLEVAQVCAAGLNPTSPSAATPALTVYG